MDKSSIYQDGVFRKIVVGSTGLGLACMLGTAASVQISKGAGLEFGWHWTTIVVAAAVIFWNMRFWKLLWELQEKHSPKTRQKLSLHLVILALLGIGSFLYPIRFIEESHWDGILRGLVTAFSFIGTLLWLIYRFGKGFAEIDAVETERQERALAHP